jgi:hypothetical protein
MKKTLMTCLAIAALFAVAGSASAITCTIDQRPAATLLVPYFDSRTSRQLRSPGRARSPKEPRLLRLSGRRRSLKGWPRRRRTLELRPSRRKRRNEFG